MNTLLSQQYYRDSAANHDAMKYVISQNKHLGRHVFPKAHINLLNNMTAMIFEVASERFH